jgi:hypothetical protein
MATNRNDKPSALDLRNYEMPDPNKYSLTARAAHCLDWAATNFPGQFIPYHHLLKAVDPAPRAYQLGSNKVENFRRSTAYIRKLLQKTYGREMITEPGVGVRATFSDTDALTVALPKKMSRFRAARRSLLTTTNLIDERNIPNTPELKPWKEWMRRSVTDVIRLVGSTNFEQKCLPPSTTSDSEEAA